MPFTSYYGPNTVVTENCLWISDGTRRICLSYTYVPFSGLLIYAASVFKTLQEDGTVCEPTQQQMLDHGKTTEARLVKRPVVLTIDTNLSYEDILKYIRKEMCYGYGCKGVRNQGVDYNMSSASSDDGSESSANTFLSEESGDFVDSAPNVDVNKLFSRKLRRIRYISNTSDEMYKGAKVPIVREFFITFKANKKTGELIYGAAISRRPESFGPIQDADLIEGHFKTAACRLDKKPVPMVISEDYRHQLSSKSSHREDVMYEILDEIMSRPGGEFRIKGNVSYVKEFDFVPDNFPGWSDPQVQTYIPKVAKNPATGKPYKAFRTLVDAVVEANKLPLSVCAGITQTSRGFSLRAGHPNVGSNVVYANPVKDFNTGLASWARMV